ncbi:MAG: hypothetical protein M1820_007352 [Bogoriella megaspora]|nr:MAG: hypothetical protein M1820_007352 [Bogoriella megaspora]
MSSSTQDPSTLTSSVKKLSLQTSSNPPPRKTAFKIADSWEDDEDASSSSSDTETETTTVSNPTSRPSTSSSSAIPSAPPPTPSSPNFSMPTQLSSFPSSAFARDGTTSSRESGASSKGVARDKRPETSTATASRLIAAGLGVKSKMTPEQREYDRSVKEKERRRVERERAEEKRRRETAERARVAVWEE